MKSTADGDLDAVSWPGALPPPAHPAKIILLGTSYSTLTDSRGFWEFRDLPVSATEGHTIAIERFSTNTVLDAATEVMLTAAEPTGNLVRNPNFKLRWTVPSQPEHWTVIAPIHKMRGWESANILVKPDTAYRLGGTGLKPGTRLGIRWRHHHAIPSVLNSVWPDGQMEGEVKSTANALYAQVLIVTDQPIADAAGEIWLGAEPSDGTSR